MRRRKAGARQCFGVRKAAAALAHVDVLQIDTFLLVTDVCQGFA
jgi:hypothetical protein